MRTDRGLAILLGLLLPCWLFAAVASAQAIDRTPLLPLIGSERLRLYTLGQALEAQPQSPRHNDAMRQGLEAAAFYHDLPRPAVIGHHLRFSPVLAWDGNINGGYLQDRFDLYGLSFDIDPANRARAGLVFGGRLSGDLRLAWAPGRYLDLQANAEAAWSPQHRIGRGTAALSACARNHVSGWTFADVCATAAAGWRSLSDSRSTAVSASVAHLFTAGPAFHELTFGIERRQMDEGLQTSVSLGWDAVWSQVTTGVSLTLAAPIPGETALRHRLSVEVGGMWRNRPVSVSLWHMRSNGGALLGMARDDRVGGVGISIQPRRDLSIELVHQVTHSSIDLFDESRTGLNVRFQLGRRG